MRPTGAVDERLRQQLAGVPDHLIRAYADRCVERRERPSPEGLLAYVDALAEAGEVSSHQGVKPSHRRPKGYADWQPQRRTRELLAAVEEVLEEYAAQLPLTVRQVYYRLVAQGVVDKTERAYKRLGEHLVRARRARLIAFDDLRDDSWSILSARSYGGVADFHDHVGELARAYRRDRQAGQRQRLELWCEAAGMMPQLYAVARDYSVQVLSAGGFASLSATRAIADRALERNVPTVMLHVGDLDPSGESIYSAMADDAAAFVRADRTLATIRLEPVRVALTPEQVAQYELPTAPAKASDPRTGAWGERGTCQLEALPPDVLADVVREAIQSRLDLATLEAQRELEASDRAALLQLPPGPQRDG